ncbi:hypothetical protein PMAYCL1PPCAC_33227, partial [Pristionchus mayeri]
SPNLLGYAPGFSCKAFILHLSGIVTMINLSDSDDDIKCLSPNQQTVQAGADDIMVLQSIIPRPRMKTMRKDANVVRNPTVRPKNRSLAPVRASPPSDPTPSRAPTNLAEALFTSASPQLARMFTPLNPPAPPAVRPPPPRAALDWNTLLFSRPETAAKNKPARRRLSDPGIFGGDPQGTSQASTSILADLAEGHAETLANTADLLLQRIASLGEGQDELNSTPAQSPPVAPFSTIAPVEKEVEIRGAPTPSMHVTAKPTVIPQEKERFNDDHGNFPFPTSVASSSSSSVSREKVAPISAASEETREKSRAATPLFADIPMDKLVHIKGEPFTEMYQEEPDRFFISPAASPSKSAGPAERERSNNDQENVRSDPAQPSSAVVQADARDARAAARAREGKEQSPTAIKADGAGRAAARGVPVFTISTPLRPYYGNEDVLMAIEDATSKAAKRKSTARSRGDGARKPSVSAADATSSATADGRENSPLMVVDDDMETQETPASSTSRAARKTRSAVNRSADAGAARNKVVAAAASSSKAADREKSASNCSTDGSAARNKSASAVASSSTATARARETSPITVDDDDLESREASSRSPVIQSAAKRKPTTVNSSASAARKSTVSAATPASTTTDIDTPLVTIEDDAVDVREASPVNTRTTRNETANSSKKSNTGKSAASTSSTSKAAVREASVTFADDAMDISEPVIVSTSTAPTPTVSSSAVVPSQLPPELMATLDEKQKKMLLDWVNTSKLETREQSAIPSSSSASTTETPTSSAYEEGNLEEYNFWSGQTTSCKCLRCNQKVLGPHEARREHYVRWHYDRYFSKKSIVKEWKLSGINGWLASRIGQVKPDTRGCLHCLKHGVKKGFGFRKTLLNHIAETHPNELESMRKEYSQIAKTDSVNDEDVHQILMSTTKEDQASVDAPSTSRVSRSRETVVPVIEKKEKDSSMAKDVRETIKRKYWGFGEIFTEGVWLKDEDAEKFREWMEFQDEKRSRKRKRSE